MALPLQVKRKGNPMNEFYAMIFKRKSMRKYNESLHLNNAEIESIETETKRIVPLIETIAVRFDIVERSKTTARHGEYCLVLYSEHKSGYLLNAGYLLAQMDLFLASHTIGSLWYALAKPNRMQVDGLAYVIMLAFGKSQEQDFRFALSDFKRKDKDTLWQGNFNETVKQASLLAPSSCNTQPWRFESDDNSITVYRSTAVTSFIPASRLPYYNSIDMGICLCFLEISLANAGYVFKRTLSESEKTERQLISVATYTVGSPTGK